MEGNYGCKDSIVLKVKSLKDSNPPMMAVGRSRQSLDADSTLLRYLCSGSSAAAKLQYGNNSSCSGRSRGGSLSVASLLPLLPVENIERPQRPVYSRQIKMEEDVVIMDGIEVPEGKRTTRLASDYGGLASPGKSLYKSEICRAWEESGNCCYGFKCQFSHGKEELHPPHVLVRNKPEENICKSYPNTESCIYGPIYQIIHPIMTTSAAAAVATNQKIPPAKPEQSSKIHTGRTIIPIRDWSPYDDNIEIALPSSLHKTPSMKVIDGYIHDVLYRPITKRRLQTFYEICSE